MNLEEIALKMIKSKFHLKDENKPFINSNLENIMYGMSIKKFVRKYFVGLEELSKYNVFMGYFNPIERKTEEEDYLVVIITDVNKTKIYCSLIFIRDNCCIEDAEAINFNLNIKK